MGRAFRLGWVSALLLTCAAGARGESLAVLLAPSSPLREVVPASFSLQDRFVLADAKELAAVLEEHPLVLTARTSAEDVSLFGKLVAADFLLTVQPGDKGAVVRLVETATGKVVVDRAVALPEDAFVAAGAVRECIVPTVDPKEPNRKPAEDAKEEAKYWQKLARSTMPRSNGAGRRSMVDVLAERDRQRVATAARAWERVLMLEPKDSEAMLNLGVCYVSLTRYRLNNNKPVADCDARMAVKGTKLVEAVCLAEPDDFNGATYSELINPLEGRLGKRAAEMNQFIVDHPKSFPDYALKYARLAVLKNNEGRFAEEIAAAVARVKQDPQGVADVFESLVWRSFAEDPGKRIPVAMPYTKSDDALTRFFAELVVAESLRQLKDAAALEHYDRMLEVHEAAYAALPKNSVSRQTVDYVVRGRYIACEMFGKQEEGNQAVVKAAAHFKKAGRFNHEIAWTYYKAVMVLGEDRPEAALEICDTYLTAKEKSQDRGDEDWARQVAEYQMVHKGLAAGQKVPDFSAMTLIAGTEGENQGNVGMAAGGGKIWLAWRGKGMVLNPGEDRAAYIQDLPGAQSAVAAIGERIYFGGHGGLFELNAEGQIVRRFSFKSGELPGKMLVDLCAAGDHLVFSFRDADYYGVGSLNPSTGKITQLAPTSAKATRATEPVYDAYRVWYAAAHDQVPERILVSDDGNGGTGRRSWTYENGAWVKPETAELGRSGTATLACLSQRSEVMTVSTEERSLVLRMKECRDIRIEQPYVARVVLPAWDRETVYLPTFAGLCSVSRATGVKKWLAYQPNTPMYSALIQGNSLYVISSRGLYRYPLGEGK